MCAKQVQWFPGHMSRALREIKEQLKLVDIVIELRDGRVPQSSGNPEIQSLIENKPKLIVLTKTDLADENVTKQWIEYYAQHDIAAVGLNMHNDSMNKIISASEVVLHDKFERDRKRGMKKRPMKAMVVGIPNVGKSTLINRISKKKATTVGNTPGVTKKQQWIRMHKDMELLDTPGVLWPKFDDEAVGLKLATIGSIKDTILPLEQIADFAVLYLQEHYKRMLVNYFQVEEDELEPHAFFTAFAKKRGLLSSQDSYDVEQAQMLFLRELRDGKIGKISFDIPSGDDIDA